MIYNTILDAVGHTPLVRLGRMAPAGGAEILVKFEGLNVGGSIKTRTALNMVEDAERRGLLKPGSIIVEPTSGNQGIGLALVGAVRGYRTVIIMPDSVSAERKKLVEHYGARVILIHDAGDIGACIRACIAEAERMGREDPRVFLPRQFSNPANPRVQRERTAAEILEQAGKPIDGFCSGVGTGGTLSGIGEALRARNPGIVIWAVEPQNAAILAGGTVGTHLQMGIGDGVIPPEPRPLRLQRNLHRLRPRGDPDGQGPRLEGRPHGRNLLRHERRGGDPPRRQARARQNRRHHPARHRRTVLLDPALFLSGPPHAINRGLRARAILIIAHSARARPAPPKRTPCLARKAGLGWAKPCPAPDQTLPCPGPKPAQTSGQPCPAFPEPPGGHPPEPAGNGPGPRGPGRKAARPPPENPPRPRATPEQNPRNPRPGNGAGPARPRPETRAQKKPRPLARTGPPCGTDGGTGQPPIRTPSCRER